ncbi:DUF6709 family protein [Ruminococcus albus]|uniref:Uncharacterized protein n=1 Tax=Ruminococcus albus TaxID=1264 RepID=A0A1H7JUL4_RUMAL|nr:DUF6709 family protein [Ruminococcus albus]SEK78222.1 hypothetical protein SAMN05216469_105208 [Ruminococcus albus]
MRNFISSRIAVLKIVAFVIGILMMIFTMGDAIKIWKKDFGKIYEKGRTDYAQDELVTGKIEYVLGTVATLESTQTVYGIPVKKQLTPYYLCYITYDENKGKDEYCVLVHATNKDTIKTMDSLVIHTQFALEHAGEKVTSSTEPVALELKAKPIPDDVMDYTVKYLQGGETSEQEIKKMLADYMLEEQDFSTARFMPLFGFIIAAIPVLMFIVSRKRARAFKNSRTHYVNQGPANNFSAPPSNAGGEPMKRYSAQAYEAHTYPHGYNADNNQQEPSAEMDSIDTSNLKL